MGKIKKVFDVPSTVEGWYFRGLGALVSLKYIKTDKDMIRSHPMLWALLVPVIMIAIYYYLGYLIS